MSYTHKTTLKDFDEAWRYGYQLTDKDLQKFDLVIKRCIEAYGEKSQIVKIIRNMRYNYYG